MPEINPGSGALLLRPVSELTRIYLGASLPGLHLIIFGLVLIMVMRYYPAGLVEPVKNLINKYIIGPFDREKKSAENSEADKAD